MSDQRDPQTYAILGACMEVHRELGCGFLEGVYQEALEAELENRGIPFSREVRLAVSYKGKLLKCSYQADFVCYGCVIVELKALSSITNIEYSQVINYLKATGFERGLLINFGTPQLEFKRFIRTSNHPTDHEIGE